MPTRRFVLWMLLLASAVAATLLFSLGVGAVFIPPGRVLAALLQPQAPGVSHADVVIVRDLRLARALLAALVGGGLAAAGAALQGLFRNPLADPFVVGASSGASLGATLAITLGLNWRVAALGAVPLAAFAGALLAVFLVYAIAQVGGRASAFTLLLAGAALGTILSAVVSLAMLLRNETLHEVFAWLMGGFSGRSWVELEASGPFVVVGVAGLWFMARPLDALACGEETAMTLGLPLSRARGALVAAASLATAGAVAAGGVISFVGLVAPHIARLLFGTAHSRLIPASILIGMLLLLVADDLARTVVAPMELPVGLLTSSLGGIFFLVLLKSRRGELAGG